MQDCWLPTDSQRNFSLLTCKRSESLIFKWRPSCVWPIKLFNIVPSISSLNSLVSCSCFGRCIFKTILRMEKVANLLWECSQWIEHFREPSDCGSIGKHEGCLAPEKAAVNLWNSGYLSGMSLTFTTYQCNRYHSQWVAPLKSLHWKPQLSSQYYNIYSIWRKEMIWKCNKP